MILCQDFVWWQPLLSLPFFSGGWGVYQDRRELWRYADAKSTVGSGQGKGTAITAKLAHKVLSHLFGKF
jgi:hypothetical protein